MKLYLSGPMSNIPAFNIPAFNQAAAMLRGLGHEVVSPPERDPDQAAALGSPDGDPSKLSGSYADAMARAMKILFDEGIEAVMVLPDWNRSTGARLEVTAALLLKKRIYLLAGGCMTGPMGAMTIKDMLLRHL